MTVLVLAHKTDLQKYSLFFISDKTPTGTKAEDTKSIEYEECLTYTTKLWGCNLNDLNIYIADKTLKVKYVEVELYE